MQLNNFAPFPPDKKEKTQLTFSPLHLLSISLIYQYPAVNPANFNGYSIAAFIVTTATGFKTVYENTIYVNP